MSSNITEVANKIMCLGSTCYFLIWRNQEFSFIVSLSIIVTEDRVILILVPQILVLLHPGWTYINVN